MHNDFVFENNRHVTALQAPPSPPRTKFRPPTFHNAQVDGPAWAELETKAFDEIDYYLRRRRAASSLDPLRRVSQHLPNNFRGQI